VPQTAKLRGPLGGLGGQGVEHDVLRLGRHTSNECSIERLYELYRAPPTKSSSVRTFVRTRRRPVSAATVTGQSAPGIADTFEQVFERSAGKG
jgi:hypothetical protein